MLVSSLKSCGRPWSVCEVLFVLYLVAVTVMHVLLFVLHVCMRRECEGEKVTTMLVRGTREVGCGECGV